MNDDEIRESLRLADAWLKHLDRGEECVDDLFNETRMAFLLRRAIHEIERLQAIVAELSRESPLLAARIEQQAARKEKP